MMKKSFILKWLVLTVTVSLLAACGGGGGGSDPGGGGSGGDADGVTYLISGGTEVVRTETFDLNVPIFNYDPYIEGSYYLPTGAPGTDKTVLKSLSSYVDGVGFTETVEIAFEGNSTGTFSIGGKNAVSVLAAQNYLASSGTITVVVYESVGGHISGTFSVSNGSKTMTGTFSVTRETDL